MTHRCTRGLLLVASLMIMLVGGLAQAGTIDPLLVSLRAQRAGKAGRAPGDLDFTRLLAIEPTGRFADPIVGVIMDLEPAASLPDDVPGLLVGSRHGTMATGRLPLSSVPLLASRPGVHHVQASRLMWPLLDAAVPAGRVDQVWAGTPAYTGDGVLVGVIDSGIDWRHPDFASTGGQTRIVAIWDLWASGTPPTGFAYGAEYTAAAIDAGTANQRDFSGHGTHVTGIAAGNGQASADLYRGVAFEADILVAKAWSDVHQGFAEDRTIDAMNYLVQKAASLGQPIAINMSLGGHFGPHDGTRPQEQLIDQLSGEGVVFCVAAGNEGESSIADQAPASSGTLTYRIASYTPNAGTDNDFANLIIWVDGAVSPTVTVQGGGMTVGPVFGGVLDGASGVGGTVVVDNASSGADPLNGDRLIIVQFDDRNGTPPAADDWTITLAAGTGTAHAWHISSSMTAGWPLSDQRYSVGMPASSAAAVTVGALKTRNQWPSLVGPVGYNPDGAWGQVALGDRAPFSSIGPTRDGREKPDLTAPGMAVVSCYSQDTDPVAHDQLLVGGGRYLATQGTSMAAPFACGVVALMLEKNPALTAAEVQSILRATAVADAQTGATWNEYFGAGKLDALAALAAVPGDGAASGDIDADGRVTVLDLVALVNHILDPVGSPLDGDAREAADAFPAPSGDGVLNAQDLALLIAFVLAEDPPTPGPALAPVQLTVGDVVTAADGRWIPLTLTGAAVAAGQLVLRCEGAGWPPGPLVVDAPVGVTVDAQVVGDEVRLMFFSLDPAPFVAGAELRVPVPVASALPPAEASSLLVAAIGGERLEAGVLAGGQPRLTLRAGPSPSGGPFSIHYSLARQTAMDLSVYDLRGRRVRQLRVEPQAMGGGVVVWDGRDDLGHPASSGIYMVRLVVARDMMTRKLVLRR